MCGIIGLYTTGSVVPSLIHGLSLIQHRGQDAAGITVADAAGQLVSTVKGSGLAREVLTSDRVSHLVANVGIGHVRYPTAGALSGDESQPFYVNSPYGLSLVHNGNLTNTGVLRDELTNKNQRHLNTRSDSELLLNVVAHELSRSQQGDFDPDSLFKSMRSVCNRIEGAYSCLLMINGQGLLAFRDPLGIRPLVYGTRKSENGEAEHVFASESVVLDALGFELVRDVSPGEALFVDLAGRVSSGRLFERPISPAPCLFEYVYLSRPDSVVNGVSVYAARREMGDRLGRRIQATFPKHDIDVVIPIPDTSRPCAHALAKAIQAEYSEGFVKNRYVGRTFIMPDQLSRQNSIALKLNAIQQEFAGKVVLLVDNSVVRGNTSQKIVALARAAGAKKVYFASAAPPVLYPNHYGIDMPTREELVAHNRTHSEIEGWMGVDRLFYQTLTDLKDAVNEARLAGVKPFERFEESLFSGIRASICKQELADQAC